MIHNSQAKAEMPCQISALAAFEEDVTFLTIVFMKRKVGRKNVNTNRKAVNIRPEDMACQFVGRHGMRYIMLFVRATADSHMNPYLVQPCCNTIPCIIAATRRIYVTEPTTIPFRSLSTASKSRRSGLHG